MITKICYLCNVQFHKPDQWAPTKRGKEERLHCSQKCYFMYRIAYNSDPTLRIEHAIKRAKDAMAKPQPWGYKSRLRERIKELRAALKRLNAQSARAS